MWGEAEPIFVEQTYGLTDDQIDRQTERWTNRLEAKLGLLRAPWSFLG